MSLARRTLVAAALLSTTGDAYAQPSKPGAPACTTTCSAANGYYAPDDDRRSVASATEPLLVELRGCIQRAGGTSVVPALNVHFSSDGELASIKPDLSGYDGLACVADAMKRSVRATTKAETMLHCEHRCGEPAAVAPPPVLPPPPLPPAAVAPASAPPAPAAPPSPPPPPPPPPKPTTHVEKRWYGYQTLISDGTAIMLGVVGASSGDKSLGTLAGAMFYLGPPVIHWVHGNVGPGFGSLALRLFAPPLVGLVGLAVGAIAGASEGNNSGEKVLFAAGGAGIGLATGVALGAVLCIALDATVFGYDKATVPDAASLRPKPRPWYHVEPMVGVSGRGSSLGVIGSF